MLAPLADMHDWYPALQYPEAPAIKRLPKDAARDAKQQAFDMHESRPRNTPAASFYPVPPASSPVRGDACIAVLV